MSHLSTVRVVDAPAVTVFDIVVDPARSPEWQTMLIDISEIAGRPGGVGSSYLGHYRVAGRRLAARFVVTAAERPTLHQVAGTATGGWARWTTEIEPRGGACELRILLEYELPGEIFGSLFGRLAGNRVEQEFRRTYDRLKEVAERVARTEPTPIVRGDEHADEADESAEALVRVAGRRIGGIVAR
jgi:hypothetical protein